MASIVANIAIENGYPMAIISYGVDINGDLVYTAGHSLRTYVDKNFTSSDPHHGKP